MGDQSENLHGLKAKMTGVKGRITKALKEKEITCAEFAKKNQEATPTLKINRLAQEILEKREKLEKQL